MHLALGITGIQPTTMTRLAVSGRVTGLGPDRDREKLPRAKPPAERIQTQERLAKAFFGCGSVAFAAFVRPFLHGTAQAYFAASSSRSAW